MHRPRSPFPQRRTRHRPPCPDAFDCLSHRTRTRVRADPGPTPSLRQLPATSPPGATGDHPPAPVADGRTGLVPWSPPARTRSTSRDATSGSGESSCLPRSRTSFTALIPRSTANKACGLVAGPICRVTQPATDPVRRLTHFPWYMATHSGLASLRPWNQGASVPVLLGAKTPTWHETTATVSSRPHRSLGSNATSEHADGANKPLAATRRRGSSVSSTSVRPRFQGQEGLQQPASPASSTSVTEESGDFRRARHGRRQPRPTTRDREVHRAHSLHDIQDPRISIRQDLEKRLLSLRAWFPGPKSDEGAISFVLQGRIGSQGSCRNLDQDVDESRSPASWEPRCRGPDITLIPGNMDFLDVSFSSHPHHLVTLTPWSLDLVSPLNLVPQRPVSPGR